MINTYKLKKYTAIVVLMTIFFANMPFGGLGFVSYAANSSAATYFTTDDNENNARQGVADGDLTDTISRQTVSDGDANHPIEFNINVTGELPKASAILTIYGYDCDEEQGEIDYVYFNGTQVGYLSGENGKWSTTSFALDPSLVQTGNNFVEIYVDPDGWVLGVDWGQLVVDGGAGEDAKIVDLRMDGYDNGSSNIQLTLGVTSTIYESANYRLEVNVVDENGNNHGLTSKHYTKSAGDTLEDTFNLTYNKNSASGNFVINAFLFNDDTGILEQTRNISFEHEQGQGVVVDETAPTVTNVTSKNADGIYKEGDNVLVDVVFDENVNVIGSPRILLETGPVDRYAEYLSGTGTNTLTFEYVVEIGDRFFDLDYFDINALKLNSGSIKDSAGNAAVLKLPEPGDTGSISFNKDICVWRADINTSIIIDPDKEYGNEDYMVTLLTEDSDGTVTESVYASVYYKLSGMSDFVIYEEPFFIDWEGETDIEVMVVDRFGTIKTNSRTVMLDKTAPNSQDTVLSNDRIITMYDPSILNIGKADRSDDTIWIAPQGTHTFRESSAMTKAAGHVEQIDVPELDGEYRVFVLDKSGNISQPSNAKIIVDRTPPSVYGVEEGKTYTDYKTITFSDGTATLNGEAFENGGSVETNGSYELIVTDEYGNKASVAFVIDNDLETVNSIKEKVEIGYAEGDSANRVTQDVSLPESGEDNTSITWTSSNKDIMNDDGTLIQIPSENTQITLTATIRKGNIEANKTFVITVLADVNAPELVLLGDEIVTIEQGNLYVEKGYTAIDEFDGDLTDEVKISGYLNTEVAGNYVLTYTVADMSGNKTSVNRTIVVISLEVPTEATVVAEDNEKIEDSKIEQAIEGAKQNNKKDIKIKVNQQVTTGNDVSVSISKKQVENAKKEDVKLIFETENTAIEIPMSAVNTDSMNENARLEIVCERVDTSKATNNEMVEAVKNVNESMEIYENNIYDFKMKIVEEDGNGNVLQDHVIENFISEEDIILRIFVGKNIDDEVKFMTFYYNPDTGEWEYVRGKYESELGSIKILTKHLSIYSVMNLTKAEKLEELTKLINKPDITIEEVLNIIEDADMEFDQESEQKYNSFEDGQKEETAQGIIDSGSRPYGGYVELKDDFGQIVDSIFDRLNTDNVAPTITLNGPAVIYMRKGQTYMELGATAEDNLQGNISGSIIAVGEVDTDVVGEYAITYWVEDMAGNKAEITRTIIVSRKKESSKSDSVIQENDSDFEIIKGMETLDVEKVSSEEFTVKEKGLKPISNVYQIKHQHHNDAIDGQIKIYFDENEVEEIEHIGIFVYDESNKNWKYLGGKVNRDENYITLDISIEGKIAVMEKSVSFKDMDGHWAKDIVEILAAKQIIDGDGNGNFNPNMGITRAEFAALLVRTLGIEMGDSSTGFDDVRTEDWFAPYVAAARNADVVKGVSETDFEPYRIVNREEMTAMVMRAYRKVKDSAKGNGIETSTEKFKDNEDIGNWAKNDVYTAKELELIEGRAKDLFVPKSETLRGEAATLIYRFLKALDLL